MYTELQYRRYGILLEQIANASPSTGYGCYLELKDWFVRENISNEIRDAMDERMEREFIESSQ